MQLISTASTDTVEKIILRTFGAPEVLQFEKSGLQVDPKRGILVETWAIGVGYVDVMAQRGGYFLAPRRPFSPGYEFIGRVVEAHDSDQFAAGDLVAGLLPQLGAYQTLLQVPASRLVKLPAGIDLLKSAASILNYLTARCILDRKAKVKPGDAVLIHGASGGVGMALAQIGRNRKLKMYGTASSSKHDLLQALGVSPIDYRQEDFLEVLKKQYPEGVDAAFDAIGGSNLRKSVRAVKRGGVVVSYGFSGNNYGGYLEMIHGVLQLLSLNLLPNGKKVIPCGTPAESVKHPNWYRQTLSEIFEQIQSGAIDPVLDQVFPFHQVREAHAYLEGGKARGKVLLTTQAFSGS